ncbi:sulfotransferase [Rhodopirellula europaea]|uniref:sulfotransferase n=1 Tax=Rhodopirellula europaea TaxID=1263866 RepID=UPI003D2D91CB
MNSRLPNCLYIGPGKTGSTWLFEFFKYHPDIYVTPAKDLYFFDQFYQRGTDWYAKQFAGATTQSIIAEICHDYIVSTEAPLRIKETVPEAKLVMFLREPSERAFSAYLYRVKHGICEGSFEDALRDVPEVFSSSLYANYIERFLEHHPKEHLLVFAFDDLRDNPQAFANQVCDRLLVDRIEIHESLGRATLKAAKARSLWVAKLVKHSAVAARRMGAANLVGRLKTNRMLQKSLYRDFAAGEKPVPSSETIAELKDLARPSVLALDEMMGTNFCERWGY